MNYRYTTKFSWYIIVTSLITHFLRHYYNHIYVVYSWRACVNASMCVCVYVCLRVCVRTSLCNCLAFVRLVPLSSLFRLFLPPVWLSPQSHTFTPYSEFSLRSITVPQQSNCPSLLVCPPIVLPFQRFLSQSYIWLFCETSFLVSHFHPWCDMTSRVN